ncbi:phage head-tail connector protein [Dyadobacter sp. CY351]|uniref:head-tail connector protein n=1 Tax=Dyadobacter sp. CY351 TaxID=2909337 RepID=UPI001F3DC996|nr:phage head-tail connector protein [Dyadobacter sp. CY351]MCF2517130.1 phage head-tail connector protein [Dyadobacter sp. CY351]
MTSRGISIKKQVVDGAQEPVTLEEFKSHVQVSYESQDQLLETLLVSARQQIEKFLCVSLVETLITIRWEQLTRQPLPYGPVNEIISVADKSDTTIDLGGYTLEGQIGDFMKIKADRSEPTVITYRAGYGVDATDVPEDLRLAIMKKATDDFEFRTGTPLSGAVETSLPNNWRSTCQPYRRISWIA